MQVKLVKQPIFSRRAANHTAVAIASETGFEIVAVQPVCPNVPLMDYVKPPLSGVPRLVQRISERIHGHIDLGA